MNERLPGWTEANIVELAGSAGIVTDGDWVESKDQDPSGEVRLVQLADIGDGKFLDKSSRFLNKATAERLRCTFLQKGDLLVARMPDPIGRACIYPNLDSLAVTVVDVLIWRAGGLGANPRWLMYALNSPEIRSSIENNAGGSTRLRIAGGKLKQLSLPVPPRAEQDRLAAKVDDLIGATSRARAETNLIPSLIARCKQQILKAAFAGSLSQTWRDRAGQQETALELVSRTPAPSQPRGGREPTSKIIAGRSAISVNDPGSKLPLGWDWIPLSQIARQETGHTPSRAKPEWWGGDISWIGIKDAGAHHGRIIYNTIQKTNKLGLDNSSARLLPAGTVCLSRTASVGYVTIMGAEMATSQDFATWTCTEAILPEYLMYALMSEGEDIRRFGEGSTHTTIYFPAIRAFHVRLAPLREQEEIVRRVKKALEYLDRLAWETEQAMKLLARLDREILSSAVQGRLLPQISGEEPASILLKRIRSSPKGSSTDKLRAQMRGPTSQGGKRTTI